MKTFLPGELVRTTILLSSRSTTDQCQFNKDQIQPSAVNFVVTNDGNDMLIMTANGKLGWIYNDWLVSV